MSWVVADAWLEFNEPLEGMLLHPYLDTHDTNHNGIIEEGEPLVTTLCGNLADPVSLCLGFPWENPDGQPTSDVDIVAQFWRVKRATQLAKLGGNSAAVRALTTMRIPRDKGVVFVRQRLFMFAGQLRAIFADFDQWPASAQMGACSMCWAMGAARLDPHSREFQFPKFHAAAVRGDFATMAAECEMDHSFARGTLITRNQRNASLFRFAARVVSEQLDPDTMPWEADTVDELPGGHHDTDPPPPEPDTDPTDVSLAHGIRLAIEGQGDE